MYAHADILEDRETLGKPFIASVLFHVCVVALLFAWQSYSSTKILMGGAVSYGSSVSVNAVRSIPIFQRPGPINPVANPTESQVPQKPQVAPQRRAKAPERDAIPLKAHERETTAREERSPQRYRPQPLRENQVTRTEAPAAVSPVYAKPGTTAGVGVNPNSVLGSRYAGYAAILMQRVAEHWNTGGLAGIRAPTAVITVRIFRNGSVQNPQITQRSGNSTLDYSALRAVTEAAPFPPLPPDYSGAYLDVDFQFQLMR